jgi:hypothetical protein
MFPAWLEHGQGVGCRQFCLLDYRWLHLDVQNQIEEITASLAHMGTCQGSAMLQIPTMHIVTTKEKTCHRMSWEVKTTLHVANGTMWVITGISNVLHCSIVCKQMNAVTECEQKKSAPYNFAEQWYKRCICMSWVWTPNMCETTWDSLSRPAYLERSPSAVCWLFLLLSLPVRFCLFSFTMCSLSFVSAWSRLTPFQLLLSRLSL